MNKPTKDEILYNIRRAQAEAKEVNRKRKEDKIDIMRYYVNEREHNRTYKRLLKSTKQ